MTVSEKNILDNSYALIGEYKQFLTGKAEGTTDAYLRTVRHLIGWIMARSDHTGPFQPSQLTQILVEQYLIHLEQEGLSLHHRARVKSTISNFAQFLIEEKALLQRNPTRGINLPPVPLQAPGKLSGEQRSLLRWLIKQGGDRRGAALFALGYWAGCRVSEISWLRIDDIYLGPQEGWLHIGEKGSRGRDIDLIDRVRRPLYAYLQATHNTTRTYVFTSQRSERFTEEGIYYWFRTLKKQAPEDQQDVIADLNFHDLRSDFSYRLRLAGCSQEEVTYYLGQTIIGSPQFNREQVKEKLKSIKG
ncbi:tyrosine recombinase XerD [Reticulibacter mediterranei]|uniref:Tyrosine recombinase XerD n=1 Tax=Reticulibacter mediterranei TaxID=2778369 RepID=A0A8J3N3V7_9CHLR|nr:tyrosine-type recombinase/integrase [Reticulibacter mediterranei]GHO94615.1 tyrosine recombinase XerD [Reticulibacter mediterranei]